MRSSPIQVGSGFYRTLALGNNSTMAIDPYGTLTAWGENLYGQIGTNTITSYSWTQLSNGDAHSLALRSDGTLYAWGLNTSGQLGTGDVVARQSPTQINANIGGVVTSNWTSVSAGASHTVAIASDGVAYGWGLNTSGQVGDITVVSRSAPVQIGIAGTVLNYSVLFNGSTQSLSVATASAFNIGTNSFTVEAWIYTSYSGNTQNIFSISDTGNVGYAAVRAQVLANQTIQWLMSPTTGWGVNVIAGSIKLGTWNNIAITRNGSSVYLFVNGVQVGGTQTYGTSLASGGITYIGINSGTPFYFNGYISNFRFINGTAQYTSDFTPSVSPFSNIANTSLLTCNALTIVDGSSNAFAITNNGSATVSSSVNPFIYYSGSFNGTNQSVQVTNSSGILDFGTGNFTVEMWLYATSAVSNLTAPFVYGNYTNGASIPYFAINGQAGQIKFVYSLDGTTSNTYFTSGITWNLNTWYHVAIVRNIDTISFYINGTVADSGNFAGVDFSGISGLRLGAGDAQSSNWISNYYFPGYISNFRAVKGTAVYTGNFTVPTNILRTIQSSGSNITALTGTETVLLTLQNSTFVDNSSSNFTITNNNSSTISSAIAPFQASAPSAGTGYFVASKVAAGKDYTVAIKNDNTLWSWGLNTTYQLGSGTTTPRSSPVQVGTSSWSQISAGGSHALAIDTNSLLYGWGLHTSGQSVDTPISWTQIASAVGGSANFPATYAIRSDGSLWAWGRNSAGQLGNGTVIARSSPIQIGTDSWTTIAAGDQHVHAIRSDGTLWGWGFNAAGGLGLNDTANRSSPVQITGGGSWIAVGAFAGPGGAGIKTDGSLWTWGNGINGGLGNGSTTNRSSPVQIGTSSWLSVSSGGQIHQLAIDIAGRLFSWGYNINGQLGDGTVVSKSSPVQVTGGYSWTQVTAAFDNSAGITNDGKLFTWGTNNFGQLGIGLATTANNRSNPVQVGSPTSFSMVTAGDYGSSQQAFMLGIATTGILYAWGFNTFGSVGDGTTIHRSLPVQIGALTNWTKISGSMAINSSNQLYGWGYNPDGQSGLGDTAYRSSPTQVGTGINSIASQPFKIGDSSYSVISAGYTHSAAITSDNRLFTWGNNTNGQLGFNMSFVSIAAGQTMTSVVRSDGTLWNWGNNSFGQVGDNSNITRSSPVLIGILTNWSKTTKSSFNSYAIKTDGSLWGWGENSTGGVGDITVVTRSSPVQIGTSSWTMVATGGTGSAGQQATYAITSDGKLYSWGSNTVGQLGLADTVNRSSPTQIGSSSWSLVTAGPQFALGITLAGALFSWGINNAGQLGDPTIATTVNRSSPVQIGTSSWTQVDAGASHAVGVKVDTTVYAWGLNTSGQLGNQTTINYSSPVQVGTASTSLTNANAYSIQLNGTSQYLTTSAQTSSTYFGTGDFTVETWVNLASTPVKAGGGTYSLSFNGTSQSLTTSTLNSSQYVGTGDFTIECWVYLNSTPALNAGLVCGGTFSATDWQISWSTNGFCLMPDGSTRKVNTGNIAAMSNNTWYHVAFTRTSGTLYSFLNGTMIATGTADTNNFTGTTGMLIGVNRGGTVYLPGYISNLRIIKGQAIYTGNFTPATSPLTTTTIGHTGAGAAASLTGTVVLLTGQSDTIVDNSSSAFTFTNAGSVGTSTTAPSTIYDYASIISVNNNWQWGWNDSGSYGFNFMPGIGKTTNVNTGVLTAGIWYHIAVQRVSNTVSAWVNGVNTGTNFSDTTNYNSTNSIYIGKNRHPTAIAYLPGYISNLRIIKGQGLFSGAFTPSINPLTTTTVGHTGSGVAPSITGTTVLLTAQNTNIIDNSTTAFTLTNTGSTTYSLNTPFTNAITPGALFALQISAGGTHSVAVDTQNKLYGWGLNSSGQLGLVNTTSRSAPTQIGLSNNWNSVVAGSEHTIALDSIGTLYTWGLSTLGQLGLNDIVTRSSPTQVTSMSLANMSSPVQVGTSSYNFVCTGNNTTAAISSDNKLFVWGLGTTGQLGAGQTFSRSSPVQISTNSYNLVNAGGTHTTFVPNYSPQILLATGLNTSGQLGQSTTISRSSPTQVSASATAFNSPVAVSVGDYSSYYVNSPTQVGTSPWTSVSAGGTHTLGIKSDYTLWAWGYNANGQLGGSSTINRSSPVQIGTSSWSQVSAGDSHNIIAKSDGTINAFGLNSFGQLGDGT